MAKTCGAQEQGCGLSKQADGLFPKMAREREISMGRGVWESDKGETHVFSFRYDEPK